MCESDVNVCELRQRNKCESITNMFWLPVRVADLSQLGPPPLLSRRKPVCRLELSRRGVPSCVHFQNIALNSPVPNAKASSQKCTVWLYGRAPTFLVSEPSLPNGMFELQFLWSQNLFWARKEWRVSHFAASLITTKYLWAPPSACLTVASNHENFKAAWPLPEGQMIRPQSTHLY